MKQQGLMVHHLGLMHDVFYCDPNNSTHFTTCCEVAITQDGVLCPCCGGTIIDRKNRDYVARTHAKKKGYGNPAGFNQKHDCCKHR